jgi:hypothetical protein
MFQHLKRALFISKFAAAYKMEYRGDFGKLHLELQEKGCPANELVDLYMASYEAYGENAHGIIHYLRYLYEWWILGDLSRRDILLMWAEDPHVQAADKYGFIPWITKVGNTQ